MPSARQLIGLAAGAALFGTLLLLDPPGGMPVRAWRVVAVTALMATWWITEALPIATTALLPLVLFPLLAVFAIDDAAAPYANPVIFLFMGGFLIAAAWQRTGMHRRMALTIVRIGGMQPRRLIASFMIATAFISLWVSNTATTAMLLSMAVAIIDLADADPATSPNFSTALLLGVAYAASIGGLGTLIGTPPNALLAGFMAESHGRAIGFVEWMALGIPLVLVALPVCWFLLTSIFFPVGTAPIAGGEAVVASEIESLGGVSRAEWLTAGVTALVAAAWAFRPLYDNMLPGLSDASVAIAGAALLFVLPLDRQARILDEESLDRLPWSVLILFGGGLALAAGIQDTGLASWIGEALDIPTTWPLAVTVVMVTAIVVFMSEIASNTATAAAFLPVVTALGVAMGLDPIALAIPTALAASCGFMMPVATPPNAMVYGTGRVPLPRMLRAGFALNVVMIALVTIAAVVLVPIVFG